MFNTTVAQRGHVGKQQRFIFQNHEPASSCAAAAAALLFLLLLFASQGPEAIRSRPTASPDRPAAVAGSSVQAAAAASAADVSSDWRQNARPLTPRRPRPRQTAAGPQAAAAAAAEAGAAAAAAEAGAADAASTVDAEAEAAAPANAAVRVAAAAAATAGVMVQRPEAAAETAAAGAAAAAAAAARSGSAGGGEDAAATSAEQSLQRPSRAAEQQSNPDEEAAGIAAAQEGQAEQQQQQASEQELIAVDPFEDETSSTQTVLRVQPLLGGSSVDNWELLVENEQGLPAAAAAAAQHADPWAQHLTASGPGTGHGDPWRLPSAAGAAGEGLSQQQQQQHQLQDDETEEEWERRFSNGTAVLQGFRLQGAAGTSTGQQQQQQEGRPISPRTGDILDALPAGLGPCSWADVAATSLPQGQNFCSVCYDKFTQPLDDGREREVVQLPCRHTTCCVCLRDWIKKRPKTSEPLTCPVCTVIVQGLQAG